MTHNILIATPNQGSVKIAYMKSILHTLMDLASRGFKCGFDTEEGADLEEQRNFIARKVLNDPTITHLFSVDSDMAFPGDTCAKMLAVEKPFTGAIYARRSFDYSLVVSAIKAGVPPERAQAFGFSWTANSPKKMEIVLKKGVFGPIPSFGFGAVLIHRSVFETMIEKGVVKTFTHWQKGDYYNFFIDRPADIEAGIAYSEDHIFCRKWTEDCGGTIWAKSDLPIYHIGDYGFGGSFHDHLVTLDYMDKR